MDPTRRTLIRLTAAAVLTSAHSLFARPPGHPMPGSLNLIGVGTAGERLLKAFLARRSSAFNRDFVGLVGRDGALRARATSLPQNGVDAPIAAPLVLVTGLGGPRSFGLGQTLLRDWHSARGMSRATTASLSAPVLAGAIVVLPFAWEGNWRERAIVEATLLARQFRDVAFIDNEAIDQRYLTDDEISLLQLYDRVNAIAAPDVERRLMAWRVRRHATA